MTGQKKRRGGTHVIRFESLVERGKFVGPPSSDVGASTINRAQDENVENIHF